MISAAAGVRVRKFSAARAAHAVHVGPAAVLHTVEGTAITAAELPALPRAVGTQALPSGAAKFGAMLTRTALAEAMLNGISAA